LMQILLKKVGPLKLGWCSSGINLVDFSFLPEIIETLMSNYLDTFTAIRINFFDESTGANLFIVDSIKNLKLTPHSINSGYTILHDFVVNSKCNIESFHRLNRRLLRKAYSHHFLFQNESFNATDFCQVHNEMALNKQLDYLSVNPQEIEKIVLNYNYKIKYFTVRQDGKVLTVALLFFYKKCAYYFLGGTTNEGKELNSSYFMIDQLLQYMQKEGIEKFDFGGITPFKENAFGVNKFKIGFNGRIFHYIGERNICKSKILNFVFNLILKLKIKS